MRWLLVDTETTGISVNDKVCEMAVLLPRAPFMIAAYAVIGSKPASRSMMDATAKEQNNARKISRIALRFFRISSRQFFIAVRPFSG